MIAAYEHYEAEIPRALVPPELHDIEQFYWESFWELSTCRQATMAGRGSIPWSSIQDYMRCFEVKDTDFPGIIRRMDSAYIGFMSDQSEEQ